MARENKKEKKRPFVSVKIRVMLRFLLISLIVWAMSALIVGICLVGSNGYDLWESAQHTVNTVAAFCDPEKLEATIASKENDAYYETLYKVLVEAKKNHRVTYLFIFLPREDGATYLMEAELDADDPLEIAVRGDYFAYSAEDYQYLDETRASRENLQKMIVQDGKLEACAPVFDSKGSILAIVEADISVKTVYEDVMSIWVPWQVSNLLLLLIVMILAVRNIRRGVIDPLRKIRDRIMFFEESGTLKPLQWRANNELKELNVLFEDLAARQLAFTQKRLDEQKQLLQEQEAEARRDALYQALKPIPLDTLPDKDCFSLAGQLRQAEKRRRDIYDYFPLPGDRVGILLCEIPRDDEIKLLDFVQIHAILRGQLMACGDPAQAAREAGRQLFIHSHGELPVYAFMGVLEPRSGILTYLNACFPTPIFQRRRGSCEWLECSINRPLGLSPDEVRTADQVQLIYGDSVLWYSSGIIWERSRDGKEYGRERLRQALMLAGNAGTEDLVTELLDEIGSFGGGIYPQKDHMVMMLEYARRGEKQELRSFAANSNGLQSLREFVAERAQNSGMSEYEVAQLRVCVEEIFSICAQYSIENTVEVGCYLRAERPLVRFEVEMSRTAERRQNILSRLVPESGNLERFVRDCGWKLSEQELVRRTVIVLGKLPENPPESPKEDSTEKEASHEEA